MSHSLTAPSRLKRTVSRPAKRLPVPPTPATDSAATRKLHFTPAEMRLIRKLRQESKAGFAELRNVLDDIKKLLS